MQKESTCVTDYNKEITQLVIIVQNNTPTQGLVQIVLLFFFVRKVQHQMKAYDQPLTAEWNALRVTSLRYLSPIS